MNSLNSNSFRAFPQPRWNVGRVGRTAIAPVLKTGARKRLGVRVPHPPLMNLRTFLHAAFIAMTLSLVPASPLFAQRKAAGVARNSHGRIARSAKARRDFERKTGYPHGRPGYVIDHVIPLANGGADAPANMQWQTKADAKAKDKWERGGSSHASTYRSRSYSRKSYAPRHRSTTTRIPTYRSRSTRARSYRSSSHKRR
jgi:hypothetical protein